MPGHAPQKIDKSRIDGFVKSQKTCHCERSNLVYGNYLYLLDCRVAPLLAMTMIVTFYKAVKN